MHNPKERSTRDQAAGQLVAVRDRSFMRCDDCGAHINDEDPTGAVHLNGFGPIIKVGALSPVSCSPSQAETWKDRHAAGEAGFP